MKQKHLLMSLLTLLISMTASSAVTYHTWTDSNGTSWTFYLSDGGATLETDDDDWEEPCVGGFIPKTLTVPSMVYVGGTPYTVTKIGPHAFCDFDEDEVTSIIIPNTVDSIKGHAFWASEVTSISIPNSVKYIGGSAFLGCTSLTSVNIPNSVTLLNIDVFANCTSLASITIPESVKEIGGGAFRGCTSLTSITIPNGVISIGSGAFKGCTSLTSVTISNSVTFIDEIAFSGCTGLTSVVSKIVEPFAFGSNAFTNISSNCVLTVPIGTKAAYIAAGWTSSVFKGGIVEGIVKVGSAGYATACSTDALDFSGVTDIRAYIASGFNPATGNLLLTRVTEVPAGEGLYIVGTEGSYDVPKTTTSMYYSNLLKGVTEATNISPTDGSMTNFILSDGSYGVGFYPVSSTGELAAGKAYLQLPTSLLGNNVKAVSLIFDDVEEDDPTGIVSPLGETEEGAVIYNLAGQRIQKRQKGINIVGGKKIFVK